MLKKTIKYEDYNGVERTEDFYFNLTKAEIFEMEMGTEGGLVEQLQTVVAAKKQHEIIKFFKNIVLKAYGKKSADNRLFLKTDENGIPYSREFEYHPAYSIMFMELATDDKKGAEFVNGIMPKDLAEKAQEYIKNHPEVANGEAPLAIPAAND